MACTLILRPEKFLLTTASTVIFLSKADSTKPFIFFIEKTPSDHEEHKAIIVSDNAAVGARTHETGKFGG